MIKKKILGVALIICIPVLCVTAGVKIHEKLSGEPALKANQSYVYAYITDITGNEMTYTVLEDSVVESYLEQQDAESTDKENAEAKDSDEAVTDKMPQMPSGGFEGEMPQMPSGDFEGEMPKMPSGDFEGEMPKMPSGDFEGEMPKMPTRGEQGTMGSEMVTTLLPVGITVHTQSEAETTFQRLASGDMIKMLVETNESGEEVITEIWMQ